MTHRTNARLTKKQLHLINLLAKGTELDEAAVQSGTAPATLRKWLNSETFTVQADQKFKLKVAEESSYLCLYR